MKSYAFALTTIDNPFDPFEQFEAWYNFDMNRELTHRDDPYVNCCSILARYARVTDSMSDPEVMSATENAIDQVIKYDAANVYVKVKREIEDVDDIDPEDKSYLEGMSSRFLNN